MEYQLPLPCIYKELQKQEQPHTYIDEYTKRQISDFIDKVEDALCDIWNLIRDTCMDYPEDDWVKDTLTYDSDFRFEIIDDKRVEAV